MERRRTPAAPRLIDPFAAGRVASEPPAALSKGSLTKINVVRVTIEALARTNDVASLTWREPAWLEACEAPQMLSVLSLAEPWRETGLRHARNVLRYTLLIWRDGASPLFACFAEGMMPTKLKVFAIAAALAAGTSGAAMAQYGCPAGYALYGGVCQPVPAGAPGYAAPAPGYAAPAPGYPSGPLSGAAAGGAAGAANGSAAAGPVGAVVGGALGTATGAVAGTANALTGAAATPTCGPGMTYYNGGCYPALYNR